jgi:hypothetical protein
VLDIVVLSILVMHGPLTATERNREEVAAKKQLVKHLKLTDLSLWTEARYTRHPSQADIFTPFQDFPSSFEHFPAGSIIGPQNIVLSTHIETEGEIGAVRHLKILNMPYHHCSTENTEIFLS